MKNIFKSFLFVFVLLLFFSLMPLQIQAGLVPCGPGTGIPCQLCHLFVLLNNIVYFVLLNIVPPIGALILIIGGFMFFSATGNPSQIEKGKSLLISVAIGLFIIYGAFGLIGSFLTAINVADWTGLGDGFTFPGCP